MHIDITSVIHIFLYACIVIVVLICFIADLSQIRPVYAPKDFLEVVAGLQNTNYQNSVSNGYSRHLSFHPLLPHLSW